MEEVIADVQHQIWSHWMQYMFTQGTIDEAGNWIMPRNKVDRWSRQMKTYYLNLTEDEKKSDREQAQKVIQAIDRHHKSKLNIQYGK